MTKAGLNQIDILEAVIEKALAAEVRSKGERVTQVMDLALAGMRADAVDNEAVKELLSFEKLDALLDGDSREEIAKYVR